MILMGIISTIEHSVREDDWPTDNTIFNVYVDYAHL